MGKEINGIIRIPEKIYKSTGNIDLISSCTVSDERIVENLQKERYRSIISAEFGRRSWPVVYKTKGVASGFTFSINHSQTYTTQKPWTRSK
jgi:hypothetical protein